jgi:hypothetical protein
MIAHKPSDADEAHIATAGYWREQRSAIERIGQLKELRLAQANAKSPTKPKRKTRVQGQRKTSGFNRWS